MWDYSDKVKEYFFNPKNAGVLEDANGVGEVGAISCGDALRLMIRVEPATDVICAAKFQTFGCGSAIASSAALTELIAGKTVAEAMALTNQDIADFLGGLPPEKMHCSVMGYEALRAAVANYRGEVWQDGHEDGALVCKCFGIDEGMIERTVRTNRLTSAEQVTHYCKTGGSCATCMEAIETVLARVNATMVAEGALAAELAYDRTAVTGPEPKSSDETSRTAARKPQLTNLQKIRAVEQAIAKLQPYLRADGGDCELVDVEDDCVKVRLTGACAGCQMASVTIGGIRDKLVEALGMPLKVIPVSGAH